MHTLGYAFRPWTEAKAIADGPAIRSYIRATAREDGIDAKIRFGHRVLRAEWSTPQARWTVEAERTDTGERVQMTCGFLFMCSGYYRYDRGLRRPSSAGRSASPGGSCTRRHGRTTSTTRASASSSSAAARPR